jgi:hypothetical protein
MLSSEIKTRRKKGKAKAKAKPKKQPEEKEENEENEEDEGNYKRVRDVKARKSIKNTIFVFLQNYMISYPNVYERSISTRFPLIYDHLTYEISFSNDDLEEISVDRTFNNINIIELLEEYNMLNESLPYRNLKSDILQRLYSISNEFRPLFLIDLLYNDTIIKQDDFTELLEYNIRSSSVLGQMLKDYNEQLLEYINPIQPEENIRPPSSGQFNYNIDNFSYYKGDDKDKLKELKTSFNNQLNRIRLIKSITEEDEQQEEKQKEKREEKKEENQEDEEIIAQDLDVGEEENEERDIEKDEEEKKDEEEEGEKKKVKTIKKPKQSDQDSNEVLLNRHIAMYKNNIKKQIIKYNLEFNSDDKRTIYEITDKEVDVYIHIQENLPYWVFFIEFSSTSVSDENTLKLFSMYKEIPTQFVKKFTNIPVEEQLEFAKFLFSEYPIEENEQGPDKLISRLFIKFHNQYRIDHLDLVIDYVADEDDIILKELTYQLDPEEIDEEAINKIYKYISEMTPVNLLRFRSTVFDLLNLFLNAELFVDPDKDYIDNILKIYSTYLVNTVNTLEYDYSLNNVLLKSYKQTRLSNYLDFIVPDDNDTRENITKCILQVLPDLLPNIIFTNNIEVATLSNLYILQDGSRIRFFPYIYNIIVKYLDASLPLNKEFSEFLSNFLVDVLRSRENPVEIIPDIIDVSSRYIKKKKKAMKQLINVQRMVEYEAEDLIKQAKQLNRSPLRVFLVAIDSIKNKNKLEPDEEYKEYVYRELKHINKIYKKMFKRDTQSGVLGDPKLKRDISQFRKLLNANVDKLVEEYETENKQFDLKDINDAVLKEMRDIDYIDISDEKFFHLKNIATGGDMQIAFYSKEFNKDIIELYKQIPMIVKDYIIKHLAKLQQSKELRGGYTAKLKFVSNYYKFVVAVILSVWDVKTPKGGGNKTLDDLMKEYIDILPEDYIVGIIRLAQKKATGTKLFEYTKSYIYSTANDVGSIQVGSIKLKNPLERRRSNRDKRYELIIPTGDINKITTKIPSFISPEMKECIMIHQLKPWLNDINAIQWSVWISHPLGIPRDKMTKDEQIFYSEPVSGYHIILIINNNQLDFYRPSTAYWLSHCKNLHVNNECNSDKLYNDIKKSGINELIIKHTYEDALKTQLNHNNQKARKRYMLENQPVPNFSNDIIILYTKEDENIKLLSENKQNYIKECEWYRLRYNSSLEQEVNTFKNLSVNSNYKLIRSTGINILRDCLDRLRQEYGITGYTYQQLTTSATILEDALYISNDVSVNYYFTNLFRFSIFIDKQNPIGKKANFFRYLTAHSSDRYFKHLTSNDFSSFEMRLPEILASPEISNDIKIKVRKYISDKIPILIDEVLIKIIKPTLPIKSDKSFDRLIIEKNIDTTIVLPDHIGSTFNNICKNKEDVENYDPNWIMYYIADNNVYCISKFELSNMARQRVYEHKGIKFPQKFVDGFYGYSDFTAKELKQRTFYIKNMIQSVLHNPDNKQGLDYLISEFDNDNLSLIQIDTIEILDYFNANLDDTKRLFILTALSNSVESHIEEIVTHKTIEYVKENNDLILELITSKYNQMAEFETNQGISIPTDSVLLEERNYLIFDDAINQIAQNIQEDDTIVFKNITPKLRKNIYYNIQTAIHGKGGDVAEDQKICEVCQKDIDSQLQFYTTVDEYSSKKENTPTILTICSDICFNKYKFKEPTKKHRDTGRVYKAIDSLTNRYNLTRLDMINLVKSYSIKRYIDLLTDDDLWNLIRHNDKFTPNTDILVKNIKDLEYLAKEFNIKWNPTVMDQQELVLVWNNLKKEIDFQKVFKQLIPTPPFIDMPTIRRPFYQDTDEREGLKLYLLFSPDLYENIKNIEYFKTLRRKLFDIANSKNVYTPINKKEQKDVTMFKNTLKIWFEQHKKKVNNTNLSISEIRQSPKNLSTKDMIYFLNTRCTNTTTSKYSRWTIDTIKYPIKLNEEAKMTFNTFYKYVINTCPYLITYEQNVIDLVMVKDRINNIIDEEIVLAIINQQNLKPPAPPPKGRYRFKARKLKPVSNAIPVFLDIEEELEISQALLPHIKSYVELLTEIKNIREQIRKIEYNKKNPAQKRTPVKIMIPPTILEGIEENERVEERVEEKEDEIVEERVEERVDEKEDEKEDEDDVVEF